MTAKACEIPESLKKSIIYQIFLRPFTREGTLDAASSMLPHLAELGVDIVYLCPIVLADDDERKEFWSPRQIQSELENPQNPYRMKDYYKIDPEYGTDTDLKNFVAKAHILGLKVILDLVYYHCGPAADFIDSNRDFVNTDANGEVVYGKWCFPELNFENKELREYLWRNMEYFIEKFDVDGYRCDVAARVPLDFWREGRRRMEKLKPGCIMVSESDDKTHPGEAFEVLYGFGWTADIMKSLSGEITVAEMIDNHKKAAIEYPKGTLFLRKQDSHDTANNCYDERFVKLYGYNGTEAVMVLNFMMDGIPFIYNGEEIGDQTRHSIYANRYHGSQYHINWAAGLTPKGRRRLEIVKKLCLLRHGNKALYDGELEWLDCGTDEPVLAFMRIKDRKYVLCIINLSDNSVTVKLKLKSRYSQVGVLIRNNASTDYGKDEITVELLAYGYHVEEFSV